MARRHRSGNFFVSDGHGQGNNRIVKFSADGTYLMEWGRAGTGAGEFTTPHAIAMDSQGRLFIGDRENSRIGSSKTSNRWSTLTVVPERSVWTTRATSTAEWFVVGRWRSTFHGADDHQRLTGRWLATSRRRFRLQGLVR